MDRLGCAIAHIPETHVLQMGADHYGFRPGEVDIVYP